MENEFFLNASFAPLLHMDPSILPNWQQSPPPSTAELNSPLDCFYNHNWEKSTDQYSNTHFDSALSSMVSSPVASNSNLSTTDSFAIRELIGKLGSIGSAASASATPLNSPPKPPKAQLPLPDFAADPGFAERAARFSCFGSRSFNGRMGPTAAAPKMCRVSSSPSLVKEVGPTPQEEYSTVSDQKPPTAEANPRKRKAANNKPKAKESPKTVEADAKRVKESEGEKNDVVAGKATEEETKGKANSGDENQLKASPKPPEPPKDYIHVRARRGQATDSHSLAERVRREKISERMKLLQDLVPGCNKVTGKALMLDEIINYVQSLQRQVEFLSMKLASVNTRLDGNIDPLMSKDVFQPNNAMSHPIFPLDSSAQAIFGHQSQALHGNTSSGPMTHSIDPLDTSSLCQSLGMQLNGFTDIVSQYQAFGEDDLQSIVQMGFGQNPNGDTSLQPQSIHGPNQLSHMKIEL